MKTEEDVHGSISSPTPDHRGMRGTYEPSLAKTEDAWVHRHPIVGAGRRLGALPWPLQV